MKIIGEFSNQSIGLFKEGVIEIVETQWEKFAQDCGLSRDVLIKIQDRWMQDGSDGEKFLERVEGNFYTLSNGYQKELDFLKRQGELRIFQSKRGISSRVKQQNAKRKKKKKTSGR